MSNDPLVDTQRWVDDFVVGLNLCPFAKEPLRSGRVRFSLDESNSFEEQLRAFIDEVERLVRTSPDQLSNTLLVLPAAPGEFELFLELATAAEAVVEDLEVDHLVQLASFHPEFQFEGAPPDDPANATNRSPYPMLHLLRVDEVEEAIARHPDTDAIPQRNAELLRTREHR